MTDFRPATSGEQSQATTVAKIIETVDEHHPDTKAELAEILDLSPNYVSEILRELKADGVISKAYVVHESEVYQRAGDISTLWEHATGPQSTTGADLLEQLQQLDEVTFDQYQAAAQAVDHETCDPSANHLEGLANKRYSAALSAVKDYTISTPWPGNRVASAFASIAKNLEIAGDRACFVEDAVEVTERSPGGMVHERVLDILADGEQIHEHVAAVLFDAELDRMEALHAVESDVHHDLAELFELTTAYSENGYGYLASVTHAIERIFHHWVNTAETATRLHVGLNAGHVEI
ncbi:winged helix-turn-helix domain-containing protein [Halopenitus persicus]|nr:Lrp/AsnC family transcriptional regulator [Halopenitus persicus]